MIRIFAKNCSRFDANPRSRWMRIAVHAACESLFTIDANMQRSKASPVQPPVP